MVWLVHRTCLIGFFFQRVERSSVSHLYSLVKKLVHPPRTLTASSSILNPYPSLSYSAPPPPHSLPRGIPYPGTTRSHLFSPSLPIIPLPHIPRGVGKANDALPARAHLGGVRRRSALANLLYRGRHRLPSPSPRPPCRCGQTPRGVALWQPPGAMRWACYLQPQRCCGVGCEWERG